MDVSPELHSPNLKIINMAIKSVKASLDGSILQTSNVNRSHEVSGDLAGAPISMKRKAYKPGESPGILIPGCYLIVSC